MDPLPQLASPPPLQSLQRRGHPLSDPRRQQEILQTDEACRLPGFDATLTAHGLPLLTAEAPQVLQMNLGKLCNQTCAHCHVDAGPDRREIMTRETMQDCLLAIEQAGISTADLTGGAPEMNPNFRWLVAELRRLGCHVLDRCNLTILSAPGYDDLPGFLAEQEVEVIASLPCYLESNCDLQRGAGVFRRSIEGLRRLNRVGYAQAGTGLKLNLVYNPVGPSLPPAQAQLEDAYKAQLRERFGIEFNGLYTITNVPISRFLEDLLQSNRYEEYLQRLIAAFNPHAATEVMCRRTLSVDWQGRLYDCDFNQMLDLPVSASAPRLIRDFVREACVGRPIQTGRHCFACTAGAGSSCQGALIPQ